MNLKIALEQILQQLTARRYDVRKFVFEPPAKIWTIQELEDDLSLALPPTFRNTLLTVSSHVEFAWFAPDGFEFPPPFQSNFSGDLHWSTEMIRTFNVEWESNLQSLFPDRSNAYDAVWYDKLAFHEVGNGDYLAIDLCPDTYEQIVYLSHDGSDANGYVLAENFEKLLERWVALACTGGEDWQWLPFTNEETTPIDPESTNGILWRELLGI